MKQQILSFKNFLNETNGEEIAGSTGTTATTSATTSRPETDREAKSRIAAGLVKSLFGDWKGLTGSLDRQIIASEEVKKSLPYKGCGINEPYPLVKTPISVDTFKILLQYLDKNQKGDYKRSIKELEEKRALIIGIRNKLDVKKESINQDRFIDALYFIPSDAKTGQDVAQQAEKKPTTNILGGAQGASENKILNFKSFSLLSEDQSDDSESPLTRLRQKKETPAATGATTGATPGATPSSTGVEVALGDKILPYQITTVPSLSYYGKEPINPKGTGIKLPGDTLFFLKDQDIGHGRYKMLAEGEPINVGRYPIGVTKFETYKPGEVYKEECGMEIHRSSTSGVGVCVGPWSAGCQVFANFDEWKDFIAKVEKATMNGGKFIYALIQLDDVEPILEDALKGIAPVDATVAPTGPAAEEEEDVEDAKETPAPEKPKGPSKEIKKLAKLIKTEREKTNSDEEGVIKSYNAAIKSNDDWQQLLDLYGTNLWSDLDNFLDSGEKKQLKFRDKDFN
jgi:hypothetical protein